MSNKVIDRELRSVAKSLRKAERALIRIKCWQEERKATPLLVPETVRVDSNYKIGKYPVTNEEYSCFVADTNYPAPSHWENGEAPKDKLRHPVTNVSYYDAQAYCAWLSAVTECEFRLPTGEEWTKAATGNDERLYPWGNEMPDKTRCNFSMNVGDTTPVGQYPDGASPCGALDMSGNVWEWTNEVYE